VWQRQPFALGSYSTIRVGHYTTLVEHCGTPSEDGRIHFAGEHTSIDFMGFMNGAVESGERAAAALLA
jgi:monoamine oxidase